MSTTRIHGKVIFECDDCHETLETQEHDWDNALQIFKDEGWRNLRRDNQWKHRCPDCAEGKSR